MDFVSVVALLLFFIHIVAFIAGGANAVAMPIIAPKLATATPEGRAQLFDIVGKLSKVGKIAMATALVSGLLTLWLKWNWIAPSPVWFWIKMAGVAAMLVFIAMNEVNARKARTGDAAAAASSEMFGRLTAVSFAVVILSAVFAFS